MNAPLKKISFTKDFSLSIKREDLLIPEISGNKFRKLKYQLEAILNSNIKTVVTFGGAYSNHIAAVAAAGNTYGIKTIGIIRGEELIDEIYDNPTLSFAKKQGMKLEFVTRSVYRLKEKPSFIETLRQKFGDFHLIPEGGTNTLAIKGCTEILNIDDSDFDYICVSVGTGGTLAGIVSSLLPHQKAIGFSALKGTFQKELIEKTTSNKNFEIIDTYNFGGYAKIDDQLIRFINDFKQKHNIPLDPVYTGKMMYGVLDLIEKQYFKKNSRILAIHTGGLQGIAGMNKKLNKKKLPLIL